MKSSGRDRESSRSGLVATLLLSSLALAGVLTWQAQASMRYHRGAAEKVLRDYAMLAADEFARRTVDEIGFYGFYPLVTAVRQEAAHGRLVPPAEIQASRDETLQPAADLLRSTFRYDVRSGRLETLGPDPDPATREWMVQRLAAEAASAPRDRRYATVHGVVGRTADERPKNPDEALIFEDETGTAAESRRTREVSVFPVFAALQSVLPMASNSLILSLIRARRLLSIAGTGLSLPVAFGLALVAFLAGPPPAAALDPSHMLAHYGYDMWDSDSGLPQNSVETILQTRDGYIWLGTQEGLVRFDGVHFQIFDTRNTDALGDDFIRALCETRNGDLWIGTINGLARYRGGRFDRMTYGDVFEGKPVFALHESADGALWIGSRDGLSRLSGNVLTRFRRGASPNSGVRAIAELPGGEIWTAGVDSLARYREGDVTRYGPSSGVAGIINALAPNGAGGVWFGSDMGFFRFDAGQAQAFPLPEAKDPSVQGIYADRDGTLWVASQSGLYGLRNGKLLRFAKSNGLSSNLVLSVLEDREGSLWIGTSDGGLNRIKDQRIANYTQREGLPENKTWTVFEDRDRTLWVGSGDGVLSRMDASSLRFQTIRDFGAIITTIAQDRTGTLWLGTKGNGLYRSQGRSWRSEKGNAPSDRWVSSVCAARDGTLWVAYLGGGVVHFEGERRTRYDHTNGLPGDSAFSLFEDRQGDIWLGMLGGGAFRFHRTGSAENPTSSADDFTIQRFTVKDGLTHNAVLSIEQDQAGIYWLGTRGGLSRYDGRTFTTYRKKEGVFHDAVQRAIDDGHGYLWLTTNRGVFRVRLSELNAVAENPSRGVHPVEFPTGNGMRSAECNNAQHGVAKSRDGRLWFATMKGLAMADPAHIEINRVPPKVVIEDLLANGRKAPIGKPLELSPETRDLEIRYTALSFRVPGAIRFRYRLEGFDAGWVEAGARRVAYYTNLPAGRYTFRITASNEDGLWSAPQAYAAFTIERHLYDTPGFRIGVALALGLAVAAAHWTRMRRLRQREGLRAELVEAKLDALRVQLRPHFLFNTFNAVLPTIDSDPPRAKRMILQLAELLRTSLKTEPGRLVTIEEELAILEQYADIERTRFGDRVRITATLDPAARSARVPSFLLQPLVENAIKHGMKGHSRPVTISIRVEPEGGALSLCVRDNGRGLPEKGSAPSPTGIGLNNVARRLEALFPKQHSFQVTNREGGGCEASIRIPLSFEKRPAEREIAEPPKTHRASA